MILSGQEIKKRIHDGSIGILPYNPRRVNPNSYNVTLADELVVYKGHSLDMRKRHDTKSIRIPTSGLLLKPGRLYLGSTVEYTAAYDCVPMLEGRSSIGRLGVFVHATAGFGDVGFRGRWTLEISCVQPVRIYAGVEIAQLYFHTIEGDFSGYKYGVSGKYQDQRKPLPSLLWKEFQDG